MRRPLAVFTLVFVTLSSAHARQAAPPAPLAQCLMASGYNTEGIHLFDFSSGAKLGFLGGSPQLVPGAQSLRFGPDGALYACAEKLDRVLRFDGATGALLGTLVADDPNTPQNETGGLDGPTAAVFGADGKLYVASFDTDRVLRYDGTTGAFLDVFVGDDPNTAIDETGGLDGPDAGMTFGPDGLLYVPSFESNKVLRYAPKTGAFVDVFTKTGALSRPRMIRFRGDGTMFVTSWGNGRILKYALDGTFLGQFATSGTPTGLVFEPGTGHVLVTSDNQNYIRRFHGITGQNLGNLVTGASSGITGGTFLEVFPNHELGLGRLTPGTAGATSTLAIRNATPADAVFVIVGAQTGSQQAAPCPSQWIGVAGPVRYLLLPTDASGSASLSLNLPIAYQGKSFALQAFALSTCRASNLVVQTIE